MEKPHNTSRVTGDNNTDRDLECVEESKIGSWNSSEERQAEIRNSCYL